MQRLLHAHRPRVLAYVRMQLPARLSRVVDAEDVLQDTCFEAFRQISRFAPQGEDCFFRWLATIARNHMVDLLRRQRALKRGGDGQQDQELIVVLEELAIHRHTPSKSAARRELLATLEQAIERLPEDYRMVIKLRHVEGLAVGDVALRLGRSEGAVSMLILRGLKALRMDLKSMSYFV